MARLSQEVALSFRALHLQITRPIETVPSFHVRPALRARWTRHPLFGWHIDKGVFERGRPLAVVCIVHATDVLPEGGGVTFVQGSARWVDRLRPFCARLSSEVCNLVLIVASHVYAWLAPASRKKEVTLNAGDVAFFPPRLIHSTSTNSRPTDRVTFRVGFSCVDTPL